MLAASVLTVASCGAACEDEAVATTNEDPVEEEVAAEPEPVDLEPASPLVSEELAAFKSRSVAFANFEFRVTAVRVSNQDLSSYAGGGDVVVDESATYAYLDVTAVNLVSVTQSENLPAFTYKLLLDGVEHHATEQIGFLSDLTGYIRPYTGVDSFLAFPVPDDVNLVGSTLLIEVPPQRRASLPLTVEIPAPPTRSRSTSAGRHGVRAPPTRARESSRYSAPPCPRTSRTSTRPGRPAPGE